MSVCFYSPEVLTGLTPMQEKDSWGDDMTSTHRHLALRTGPSLPRRHNFFDFLRFRQPVDGSPSRPLQARCWNFSLLTKRVFTHTVEVIPARDEDVSRSPLMLHMYLCLTSFQLPPHEPLPPVPAATSTRNDTNANTDPFPSPTCRQAHHPAPFSHPKASFSGTLALLHQNTSPFPVFALYV
jgi:hypothetical protein